MTYTFHDFPEAAYGSGFGYPTDVKYGSIYLGTLINLSDGVVIKYVDTPDGKKSIKPGGTNRFKTKEDAAKTLHKTWAFLRRGEESVNESTDEERYQRDMSDAEEFRSKMGTSWTGYYDKEQEKKWYDDKMQGLADTRRRMDQKITDDENTRKQSDYMRQMQSDRDAAHDKTVASWNKFWSPSSPSTTSPTTTPHISPSYTSYYEPSQRELDKLKKDRESRDKKNLASKNRRAAKKLEFEKLPPEEQEKIRQQRKRLKQSGWDKFISGLKDYVKYKKIDPKTAQEIIKRRWETIKKQFSETEV